MSEFHSPRPPGTSRKIRSDGWTAERQLRFLDALADGCTVSKAAAAAGMSRESAYRLRERRGAELFAALWDRALEPDFRTPEVHIEALTNGRIMRLLGNQFRRERGDFIAIGSRRPHVAGSDRTRRL